MQDPSTGKDDANMYVRSGSSSFSLSDDTSSNSSRTTPANPCPFTAPTAASNPEAANRAHRSTDLSSQSPCIRPRVCRGMAQ